MKRRGFFVTAALGGLMAGREMLLGATDETADGQGAAGGAGWAAGGLVTTPPVVMAPRADGVEIGWAVTRLSRGWIEVKTDAGVRRFAEDGWGFVPQGDTVIRVRLGGLEPGKLYRYRAVTEAMAGEARRVESGWREFRTLNPEAESTRFVVWNDTHDQAATLEKLDELSPAADFLVWNGDACSNVWSREAMIPATLLRAGGTDFTARRPLAFCMGNHDQRGAYGFRVPRYIATPDGRPYYAFRSGPLAAVVLDTGEDKADGHPSFKGRVASEALRREQAAWLEREVIVRPEFRDAPFRVVFCHLPLRWTDEKTRVGYDWFSERSRKLWNGPLVKWRAQLIISGHTHEAAKIEAGGGFPYAQIIGGGPKLGNATWIEGVADAGSLRVVARTLDGKTAVEMKIAAG